MDKTLPYYDIIMRKDMNKDIKAYPLPEGYSFASYKDGDEQEWARLEHGVGEFDNIEDALAYFNRVFMPYREMLYDRMYFILDPNGQYVATTTAWFKDDEKRHYALVHWVCVDQNQQGKGLGNCMVSYVLSKFPIVEPNEKEIFLHTQTWSYPAISMYYKMGFRITDIPLIDCKTDHKALDVLRTVLLEEVVSNLME